MAKERTPEQKAAAAAYKRMYRKTHPAYRHREIVQNAIRTLRREGYTIIKPDEVNNL